MESITHNKRYLPHEVTTKTAAVNAYRRTKDIGYTCRKYRISKASLMRWNKRYDGTAESLKPKSHRPLRPHPNSHTIPELRDIENLHRRNPHISVCEMYGKLVSERGYKRHPGSLYRVFCRLGYREVPSSAKKKSRHLGHYDTPELPGMKWQMDVKYVPAACYSGTDGERFFQYTMLDECTRERYIHPYKEQSGYSTVDFVKRAVRYFGYTPKVIQTDNGGEFTNFSKTDRIHALDILCKELGIIHKLIRPRTPWHNGKVERSHRNDQERFYDHLHFYSHRDLSVQMERYLYRSNRIPMSVLGWKTPIQERKLLTGEI